MTKSDLTEQPPERVVEITIQHPLSRPVNGCRESIMKVTKRVPEENERVQQQFLSENTVRLSELPFFNWHMNHA